MDGASVMQGWTYRFRGSLAVLAVAAGTSAFPGCQKPAKPMVRVSLAESPFNPEAPAKYVIYPGDVLLLKFPTDSTLDQQAPVRSDGMISVPYLGDVPAAQRTPEELVAELETRLAGFLQKPEVTVIVSQEAGRRVYVGGQVLRPGAVPLQPNQTLAQAMFEVGGVTETANPASVLVLRTRLGEGRYVLQANLGRILAGQESDIRLEPYDVVFVAESGIARVDRFVEQYINRIIPRAAAFPFTTELSTQPVRVVNRNDSVITPVTITR
ncbi:MAG: polysaccharide biosynthesis/export family protein [Planctomycetes bacterium]|nr:polysaccharide biosynthesis/export family protein [Planctomycetota bacterium]